MMKSLSFWEKNSFFKGIDVAVIGSGIVGLNAAMRLKEIDPALDVLIVEAGPLPSGASSRNAGFACFGSMSELLEDLEQRSEDAVFGLVERRWKGLEKLRAIVGDSQLHYQPFGGFEVFAPADECLFQACTEEMERFNLLLKDITGKASVYQIADSKIRGFGLGQVGHLIENTAEGQIDTGKMMRTLLAKAADQGVRLINGLKIEGLEDTGMGVSLQTSEGWHFSAKKVLVATNGFSKKLLPSLDLWPARNQVLITQPLEGLPIKGSFHYDRGYFYFRNVDDPANPGKSRILLGGGRNLAPEQEQTDVLANTPLIQDALKKMLGEMILPGRPVEIEGWWSGILGLGPEKKPILQMVSPNIGASVRLGGMGVAIGSLLGIEAAEMVLNLTTH